MPATPSPIRSVEEIEARLQPLRRQLETHPLYAAIQTVDHLRLFMQSHVFAVWDFMSLLKSLQARLTCVAVPWVPTPFPESRRFLNEIVLGEESDLYQGRAASHFEIYLEAMRQAGADSSLIRRVVEAAPQLDLTGVPEAAQQFVRATFGVIEHGSVAAQAAAFTFGREDAIPGIFRALVRSLNLESEGRLDPFVWYLERHIEVDGEDHGPLSLRMVADLCGTDDALWDEAAAAAEDAIRARLRLWDGILTQIRAA
jgi:hypothetical protein